MYKIIKEIHISSSNMKNDNDIIKYRICDNSIWGWTISDKFSSNEYSTYELAENAIFTHFKSSYLLPHGGIVDIDNNIYTFKPNNL